MPVIRDIAFVRYQATELDSMEAFLVDFGMTRATRTERALYMRGHGPSPHIHITEVGESNRCLGFGVYAQSAADLVELAERFGTEVQQNEEPGGGERVRIVDPAGFVIDVIYGQATLPQIPHREPLQFNSAGGRLRMGRSVRLKPAPSTVVRLGHLVLLVPDFPKSLQFYQSAFGMRPSDSYFAGAPGNIIASFMHCGLGATYTDHHTIALITAQDGVARFDHSAFEVLDMDDVMQGNAFLKSRNYKHSWGVGRHIQGSQIFDYWRDPVGNKIEHWTDGDLVNEEYQVGVSALSGDELQQWAPPLHPDFFA